MASIFRLPKKEISLQEFKQEMAQDGIWCVELPSPRTQELLRQEFPRQSEELMWTNATLRKFIQEPDRVVIVLLPVQGDLVGIYGYAPGEIVMREEDGQIVVYVDWCRDIIFDTEDYTEAVETMYSDQLQDGARITWQETVTSPEWIKGFLESGYVSKDEFYVNRNSQGLVKRLPLISVRRWHEQPAERPGSSEETD